MNASKPALITTFIGTQALTPLIAHLARPKIQGGLALEQEENGESESDVWKNDEDNTFVIELKHSELKDVMLMQLVINPGGEAPDAWQQAAGQLERAMRDLPKESEEALLGMTLIYQAVVPANADPDAILTTLLDDFKLHTSSYYLYLRPLASSEVRGGKLWLLESALQDNRNVYMALGTEAEQGTLTNNILFGKDAALLWADTIAHKAYFMLRDYGDAEHRDYREANNALTERVQTILKENRLPVPTNRETHQLATPENSNILATLNDLSSKAAKFTNLTVALQQLQSDLEVHRFHLNPAAEQFATQACPESSLNQAGNMAQPSNPITTYHLEKVESNIFRIHQDLATASATQNALNTAINYLRAIEEHEQTQLAKRQEKNNHEIQLLIAVFGVIIGVGQIVVFDLSLVLTRIVIAFMIGGAWWWWYKHKQGRF